MRSRIVAALAAATVVASASAASALPSVQVIRFDGADRYDTAHEIAVATYDEATVAVLASGENFPDALAASYVAGATNSPVVFTERTRLSSAALATLNDLNVGGVLIAGGTDAISSAVEDELLARGFETDRLDGADRYATARAMAESVPEENIGSRDPTVGRTAFLATGEKFPDALAAGPLSYDFGFPVLLTEPGELNSDAAAALANLDIEEVILLGGEEAIRESVANEIRALGIEVDRVGGADRMETATLVADLAMAELGFNAAHVNLARGDFFPDALAGGSHGGEEQSVIVLTREPNDLSEPTRAWLEDHDDEIASIHVFGGLDAVSEATASAARSAAGDDSSG